MSKQSILLLLIYMTCFCSGTLILVFKKGTLFSPNQMENSVILNLVNAKLYCAYHPNRSFSLTRWRYMT